MILFPYIFGRLGGGSLNELDVLRQSVKLEEYTKGVKTLDQEFEQIKSKIANQLYSIIQKESDAKVQNNLLNLKRAIFNGRDITNDASFYNAYLIRISESELLEVLKDYAKRFKKKDSMFKEATQVYKEEMVTAVKVLDELCQANYLSNGFLFASEKLSRSVGEGSFYKKQKGKTVFSLLKYLTRSVAKTTPFSSFATVFCLESEKNAFTEMIPGKVSCINPSHLIFLFIKKLLLFIPESKEKCRLSINTSISESTEHYNFFINKDNHDFLKRISRTPICDFIKKTIGENRVLNYADLIALLHQQTSGSTDEVSSYVDKLIMEGFILIHFPVSMYDSNWPESLVRYISEEINFKNEIALPCIAVFLERLSATKKALESSENPTERKMHLINADKAFSEFKKLVLDTCPEFPCHNMMAEISYSELYYEDLMGSETVNSKTIDFEIFTEKLSRLRSSLGCFDEKKAIRQSIKTIIEKEFVGKPVALLTFLEVYFNQKEKFESEANGKLIELIQSPDEIYFKIIEAIENCTNDALDLQNILNTEPGNKTTAAYGLFAQVVSGTDNPMLIVNSESSGYGKNFSRFLNYFDPTVNAEIIGRLKSDHPDALIVDVHDASVHNTNVYPSFTEYKVEIPGSEPDPRATTGISLSDLFLIVENDDVVLSWRKEQKIIPFNFSMENIKRKSSLIKFFDLFGPSSHHSLLVMEIVNNYFSLKLKQADDMIRVYPRILYESNIVLGRKKWLVKRALFTDIILVKRYDKFSFNAYFEITKWQIEHHIPDEVFVKIKNRVGNSYSSYKPQYINFQIPLLVACFISLLDDADEIIEISEMLPGSKDIKENAYGNKYVREFVLNYN